MMKLVSMLLTLCMVFCMLTVPAAADDLPVVKLDVGTTETYDDTNYKVDANTIILRAEDRVYELTGTTDRKILVPGTSTPAEPKTYHIRLNNATINGGVTINNSTGAKLVIEVAAGTVNTVKAVGTDDAAIFSRNTITLNNSIIDAEAHFDYHGISATNGVQVIGCWINTTGTETFDSNPNGIADSVLFNKKVGKVSSAMPASQAM